MKPMIDETLEDFTTRSMADPTMIRELPNEVRRLEVTLSRWNETQLSRNFYVPVEETQVESIVADHRESRGKMLPERGEPLTDGETQKR